MKSATKGYGQHADNLLNAIEATEQDLFESAKGPNASQIEFLNIEGGKIPKYVREFWTSKQRQASSIHEISYRACFKPQLPRFFIRALSGESDIVYDPFGGRGTTAIEAGLLNRNVISNDINPLSRILTEPRFSIPKLEDVQDRLTKIPKENRARADINLSMFYHRETESELVSLRDYLKNRHQRKTEDIIDRWIRMVATNRLTGHSPGFFSVYTLPPNQAVTQESQIKINAQRKQTPEYRNTRELIIRKTKSLISDITQRQIEILQSVGTRAVFLSKDARSTPEIKSESIQLTVTSPPFLSVVQYSKDNWLRCWFNSIEDRKISKKITMSKTIEEWSSVMGSVFKELFRMTRKGGWVAFEVGEIDKGKLKLDEYIVPLGTAAGFHCIAIIINLQQFTKTSNIWGVSNNNSGTNTNRIVLFMKQ